jgi:putative transcriptional regulator
MESWLKERLARLGPTEALPQVESGSPVAVLLEWAGDISDIKTIPAMFALTRRWVPLLRAKRTVEAVVAEKRAFILVPKVEAMDALTADLAQAGVRATATPDACTIAVKDLRERLGLTQEQFALRYALDIDAVRNWEHGRRKPDTAAQSYLRAISGDPEAVEAALWKQPAMENHTAD